MPIPPSLSPPPSTPSIEEYEAIAGLAIASLIHELMHITDPQSVPDAFNVLRGIVRALDVLRDKLSGALDVAARADAGDLDAREIVMAAFLKAVQLRGTPS